MKIVIVGAGAIGGTVGARLIQAGIKVHLVDIEENHVDTIRSRGLYIEDRKGGFTVEAEASRPNVGVSSGSS